MQDYPFAQILLHIVYYIKHIVSFTLFVGEVTAMAFFCSSF